MRKKYFVYFLTNKNNTTLYIGVTNNLIRRTYEHKEGLIDGFTKKYKLKKLVYYEIYNDIRLDIQREKQMKKWKREWKIKLINKDNKEWVDLSVELLPF